MDGDYMRKTIEISYQSIDKIVADEMRSILGLDLDAIFDEPDGAQAIKDAAAIILDYYEWVIAR